MLNLRPDKVEVDRNSGMERTVKRDPYVRISVAEQYENSAGKICYRKTPAIFLQRGRYYTEDGKEIRKLPSWAQEEIEKVSPDAMVAAGFEFKQKTVKMRMPKDEHEGLSL